MTPTEQKHPGALVNAYTVLLYAMACLLLCVAIVDPLVDRLLMEKLPEPGRWAGLLIQANQALAGGVALVCLAAAVLRSRGARSAAGLTAFASWLFLVVSPVLGVVPFAWWLGWVRTREAPRLR